MADKLRKLGLALSEGAMAFGSPDLYKDYMRRKEEEEKRRIIASNLQALGQGGLFGQEGSESGYVGDIDLATGQPKTFKTYSPEERASREFQKNVGAVTQAEQLLANRPTQATLRAAPKEQAKAALMSQFPQRATLRAHPDIKASKWQKGAKGTFERKPKGDITDFDMDLTDKVIGQLGTDKSEVELFIKNIPKFKAARVDINKVMNALYETATPKEKEGWLKKFMGMFTQ